MFSTCVSPVNEGPDSLAIELGIEDSCILPLESNPDTPPEIFMSDNGIYPLKVLVISDLKSSMLLLRLDQN
jgi:hypothetical protein